MNTPSYNFHVNASTSLRSSLRHASYFSYISFWLAYSSPWLLLWICDISYRYLILYYVLASAIISAPYFLYLYIKVWILTKNSFVKHPSELSVGGSWLKFCLSSFLNSANTYSIVCSLEGRSSWPSAVESAVTRECRA